MKVCVVGAGSSGLTTIKQLKDEGHEVVCFEQRENLGGIWLSLDSSSSNRIYDNLILTISAKLMSYSDFMHVGGREFFTHSEYFKYLEHYSEKFDLKKNIIFNTTIAKMEFANGKWLVTSRTNGTETSHEFDAVSICTGPFRKPNLAIKEIEKFKGEIIHSSEYRNNELFKGKRVLILGLAESGADILREVSDVSSSCALSIRSYSFLVPRLFNGKYATDATTSRILHNEMWVRATKKEVPFPLIQGASRITRAVFFAFSAFYGFFLYIMKIFGLKHDPFKNQEKASNPKDLLGQNLYPLKLDLNTAYSKEVVDFINDWNERSHRGGGNWSQKIIYCKNVSFVPNIISKKVVVKDCGISNVDSNTVFFNDSTNEDFDYIILCTGYERDSRISDIKIPDDNVRNLYKRHLHPDYHGTLAYIGFARPFAGGVPIIAEMQARYFALVCSNKIKMPSTKLMAEEISRNKNWEEYWTSLSPSHNESLPSQIMYIDSLAKEIGCLMKPISLILDPHLFVKHWFYSYNQACYRLIGPHSSYNEALAELKSEKYYNAKTLLLILLGFLPSRFHPRNILLDKPGKN